MKSKFKRYAKDVPHKKEGFASMSVCGILGLLFGLTSFMLLANRKMCDAGLKEIHQFNCTTNEGAVDCNDDIHAFEFNCPTQSDNETVINAINNAESDLYFSALGGGTAMGVLVGFLIFMCLMILSRNGVRRNFIELGDVGNLMMFKNVSEQGDSEKKLLILRNK